MLGEGAEAEVWERYASAGRATGCFNGVVELVVGDGANLRYVCEQELSERAGSSPPSAPRSSATPTSTGSRSASARPAARSGWRPSSPGRGSERAGHRRLRRRRPASTSTTTRPRSTRPRTRTPTSPSAASSPTGATAVWRGMIRVDPGAQQTDAFQESRNLLLSTDAHADAIPGLEIEADDVRCTHAAAVAQVDPEQLYYLRSRGLADAEAKRLVIEGFLQELVERAHEGPIRDALRDELERPPRAPAGHHDRVAPADELREPSCELGGNRARARHRRDLGADAPRGLPQLVVCENPRNRVAHARDGELVRHQPQGDATAGAGLGVQPLVGRLGEQQLRKRSGKRGQECP